MVLLKYNFSYPSLFVLYTLLYSIYITNNIYLFFLEQNNLFSLFYFLIGFLIFGILPTGLLFGNLTFTGFFKVMLKYFSNTITNINAIISASIVYAIFVPRFVQKYSDIDIIVLSPNIHMFIKVYKCFY